MNYIASKHEIKVHELTELLGVSGVTIRQDLALLQEQGFIRRVHGGALIQSEDEISHRLSINYEAKKAIAEQAAKLVSTGETIFIEAGSVNALFARCLPDELSLSVITNNVFITRMLKESEMNVVLLGGIFQHQSECVVGTLAQMGLNTINFTKAFLGVDGISLENGITGSDMLRTEISSEVVKKSPQVFILSDSKKIGKTAMSKICNLSDVDYLITDSGIPEGVKEQLEKTGMTVIIAN